MFHRFEKESFDIRFHSGAFLILRVMFVVLLSILILRLGWLQIVQGEEMRKFSDSNRFKPQLVTAPRGLILDREARIIVKNETSKHLKINMNSVKNIDELLNQLSRIINIPVDRLHLLLKRNSVRFGSYHPILLKKNLNLEEIQKIKLLSWDHPSLLIGEVEIRSYPLKENGSQWIGFTGEKSKKEIRKQQLGLVGGKSGLEKIYNRYLRGADGIRMIEVDSRNRISPTHETLFQLFNKAAIPGENIQLTIDIDIQKAVWKALHRKDALGNREGAVLVMKTNGEILALASAPSLDNSIFTREISTTEWNKILKENNRRHMLNKSIQEHYPPGSIIKPLIGLAGLQEGEIEEDTLIDSPNKFILGDQVFHDHQRKNYGKINVQQALEQSANTFFYQLSVQLGIKKIVKYLNLFRIGKKTDIELPYEVAGLLPTPEWKRKMYESSWKTGDTVGVSIGQSYLLTTLLQLAVIYNAIATEGDLVQPFLVHKIADNVWQKPKIVRQLDEHISKENFQIIKKGLDRVVQGEKGTAKWWKIKGVNYSGKTGTVQVVKMTSKKLFQYCPTLPKNKRHHGLFISYVPSENPEVIVAVLTENSCFGSLGAVPVARDIIQVYADKYLKSDL